ncbi:MAG: TetR/AcrR family transcriptional regulator [bacterium]|nr:TetR/AcrR family transcriptional regulator [bacterium]
MPETPETDKRLQILDSAETLFAERGYDGVSVREIALMVKLNHTTLYHHFPKGKEQMYVEVMERTFERHRAGMSEAIAQAGDDLTQQLYAVVDWLVAQPPLDMSRMQQADARSLEADTAHRLMSLAYEAMTTPLNGALEQAYTAGKIAWIDVSMASMALVTLVQTVHNLTDLPLNARKRIGYRLADLLLKGLLKR